MEIKINEAEKIVLIDTVSKLQNLQDNLKTLCISIAESRGKEVPDNCDWELSPDFTKLICVEEESNG